MNINQIIRKLQGNLVYPKKDLINDLKAYAREYEEAVQIIKEAAKKLEKEQS